MQTTRVLIDGIEVGTRLRPVDQERVDALKASIKSLGLRMPITIMSRANGDDTRFILVAGLHRLEALRQLGEEATDAIVVPDDDIEAELWEIAENLHRADLTKEQRDQHIRRYAELIEAKDARVVVVQNEPKLSARGRSNEGRPKGVAQKVAEQTGLSKSTVRRALYRPDPEIARQQQEAARMRREQDRAIEAVAAEEYAHWLLENTDLDALPTLIAWIEGSKPKDVIDALRRLTSDTPVFDRSAA